MGTIREVREVVAAAAAVMLTVGPLTAQLTPQERAALDDLGPAYAQRYELRRGWYRGQPVRYFDIGPVALNVAPVFFFVTGFAAGRPRFLEGQLPVFSLIPGLDGYSGIWQVHYAVVPPGFTANSVTEARRIVAMALRGAARLVVPGTYVNMPVVAAGSVLDDDPAQRALLPGWFQGRRVEYFDFGQSPLAPAPIYAFVTGESAEGPAFLRAQANVVDVVPDSAGIYMDMWDVHFVTVPASYVPDTIRDLPALLAEAAAGRLAIRRIGSVRNCPVVLVDGRPAPRIPLVSP